MSHLLTVFQPTEIRTHTQAVSASLKAARRQDRSQGTHTPQVGWPRQTRPRCRCHGYTFRMGVCVCVCVFYPCNVLSRQCLAHAEATLSPNAPPPPPLHRPGSEQMCRLTPHSPSHGKVPSSLACDGTGLPSSSTHQQWPRCIPLEERHWVRGDKGGKTRVLYS